MADGMWTMNDDGTFELQEPYKTIVQEARAIVTTGWFDYLTGYLEPQCPYTKQELKESLLERDWQGTRRALSVPHNGIVKQTRQKPSDEFR